MNCNMTYKRRKRIRTAIVPLLAAFLMALPLPIRAQETLPDAQVLIVYSDDASGEELDTACRMARLLTFEGVTAALGPASFCRGNLGRYDHILFCQVQDYPASLLQEMAELEKQTAVEVQFFFVGNALLKDYLNATGRADACLSPGADTGTLAFGESEDSGSSALVRLEDVLFLTGDKEYVSGSLHAGDTEGYFCCCLGRITHVTVTDTEEPLVLSACAEELFRWASNGQSDPGYIQYLVLDRVYPFSDPNRLLQTVDQMKSANIPFAVSVMPLYTHGEYPAMKRFCEVLRYAQAQGVCIILHAPLNQMTQFDVDTVTNAISLAMEAYVEQGVYPLGLQVPEDWLSNTDTAEVMSRFSTILVSPETDGRIPADWLDTGGTRIYGRKHRFIAPVMMPEYAGNGYVMAHQSAVYLDFDADWENLLFFVDICKKSPVPIGNLRTLSHDLYTDTISLSFEGGRYTLNHEPVDIAFVPSEYSEEFDYNRNRLQRFSWDLSDSNRKLVIAVSAVAVLFILFLIAARNNNRKRFFYDEDDPEEYWDNRR